LFGNDGSPVFHKIGTSYPTSNLRGLFSKICIANSSISETPGCWCSVPKSSMSQNLLSCWANLSTSSPSANIVWLRMSWEVSLSLIVPRTIHPIWVKLALGT
jgi:hypothetical protein